MKHENKISLANELLCESENCGSFVMQLKLDNNNTTVPAGDQYAPSPSIRKNKFRTTTHLNMVKFKLSHKIPDTLREGQSLITPVVNLLRKLSKLQVNTDRYFVNSLEQHGHSSDLHVT